MLRGSKKLLRTTDAKEIRLQFKGDPIAGLVPVRNKNQSRAIGKLG
jgi:hypothetical protein